MTFSHCERSTRKAIVSVTALSALLLPTFALAQGSVQNGGFEWGNFAGWRQFGPLADVGVFPNGPFYQSHSGGYAAAFGPVGTVGGIEQSLDCLHVGDVATVSFWLRNRSQQGVNSFSVSLGGETLLSLENAPASGYVHYLLGPVKVDTGTPLLRFSFRHDLGWWIVDDIQVTAEPCSSPTCDERWAPVGGGLGQDGAPGTVYALSTYQGQLVAGGVFYDGDGAPAQGVAVFDQGRWHALGGGLGPPFMSEVRALMLYNGELVAAGYFLDANGVPMQNIAAWNGKQWRSLGAGLPGEVNGLAEYNGQLVAAGRFIENNVAAHGVAVWDGTTWAYLGGPFDGAVYPYVSAIAVYGDRLYAGGFFSSVDGVPASGIAAWTGEGWEEVAGGVGTPRVRTMCADGNALLVGGDFGSAGGVPAHGLAAYTMAGWQSMPVDLYATPYVMQRVGDRLIVGGAFDTAGGIQARNVAAWSGNAWHALGSNVLGPVLAVCPRGTDLFIGGEFLQASDCHAGSVARLGDGRPVLSGVSPDHASDCAGGSTSLHVDTPCSRLSTLQWYKDGAPIDPFRHLSATTDTLLLENLSATDGGTYWCVASNDCGSVESARAVVELCGADLNCSGTVNSADFFQFLGYFFSGLPLADVNGDGGINSQDFFDFLTLFFAGC
jgi:hypothetical protein